MSTRTTISKSGQAAAPIGVVWSLLADARNYSSWALPRSTTLEREGSPTPDGVGAIRRFGSWPFFSREEVVGFDPPHRLSYVLLSGLPVRDYRADVELREAVASTGGVATAVSWTSSFEVRHQWMRTPMRPLLNVILKDFVKRLAKEAAKRAT